MRNMLFLALAAVVSVSAYSPDSVRTAMRPLSLDSSATFASPVLDYFHYYGLDYADVRHCFGSFRSDTFTISSHLLQPSHSRGTVLIVHGYYDHAGIVHNIIRRCLDSGYTVATIDLPGHGLSSGPRSSIGDFSQYGRSIGDFLKLYGDNLPRPLVMIGHSTGCASIIEYLHMYGENAPSKVILCAPLVRSTYWGLARFAHVLGRGWLKRTNRWFRNESGDASWLRWYRQEPLQETTFPVKWATAVYAWNDRLSTYARLSLPVVVIQGRKDDTVDWRNNLKVLAGMCSNLTIRMIDNGHHQLANEVPVVRTEFLGILGDEIGRATGILE